MNKLNLVKTIFTNNPLYDIDIINNSIELIDLLSISDLSNKIRICYSNKK